MRHIPPRDVVSRLSEDCHLLSRVYEVDLCRIGGCDPFIRLKLEPFASPCQVASSGGAGEGASFKAIPFQSGPAGRALNSPALAGGDVRCTHHHWNGARRDWGVSTLKSPPDHWILVRRTSTSARCQEDFRASIHVDWSLRACKIDRNPGK